MALSPTFHQPTVVALDAGSTSVRAAIYAFSGKCLGIWQQACGQTADQAAVEQDPSAILAALRACLDHLPLASDIRAAAIVSQGASVVCVRRSDGLQLSPVLSWQDRRGEPYLDGLSVAAEEVHHRSGLPLSCHYGATKIRWCLENLPTVAAAAEGRDLQAGPLMSLLLYHLCREHPLAVDSGSASRTQLWNLTEQSWDADLAGAFGVPTDILPEGRGTCTAFGSLSVADVEVPVVFANRDQQASLFADGLPQAGVAYINLGTGAFVQSLVQQPAGPRELLVNRILSGEGAQAMFSLEGTVHGAAGALPWMERHLGFTLVSQLLEDALVYVPPPDKDVYFINGVMGMGSPYWRSETIGYFSDGLTAQEKLLAWMESIVFMLVENITLMRGHVLLDRLSVSGGFSNLSGLIQRLADLTGLPCERRGDHEATLRGAAFVAAGQPDSWRPSESQTFSPTDNVALRHRYQIWRQAMSALT